MAKTGNFNHSSTNTITVTGSYNYVCCWTCTQAHSIGDRPTIKCKVCKHRYKAIYVRVNTIGGGGTSLTCKGYI